jgi:hypothetical protein
MDAGAQPARRKRCGLAARPLSRLFDPSNSEYRVKFDCVRCDAALAVLKIEESDAGQYFCPGGGLYVRAKLSRTPFKSETSGDVIAPEQVGSTISEIMVLC